MGYVLVSGGVLQAFMFPSDGALGRLGNSIAWWLGIEPYELFLYVFLPPLLLDAAVRIDFFLFKRVRLQASAAPWVSHHCLRWHPSLYTASVFGQKARLPKTAHPSSDQAIEPTMF